MSQDRRPLSPLLLAGSGWLIVVFAFALGVTRLEEMVSYPASFGLVAVLLGIAPLGFLAWAISRGHLERKQVPLVVGVFILLSLGLIASSRSLLKTSTMLNFKDHRRDYDAVVRDLRSGRLQGRPDARGIIRGESHGVRFVYDTRRPDQVEFPWAVNPVFTQVIVYDERPCAAADSKCRRERLDQRYRHHVQMRRGGGR